VNSVFPERQRVSRLLGFLPGEDFSVNCRNCAAPLTAVVGRDYLSCDFCSTFHFPTALDDSADRVKPLGQRSHLQCPSCRLQLAVGSMEGFRIRYCERCRGVLIDCEMFGLMVRERRAKHKGPPDRPTPFDPDELERRVDCPSCQRRMQTHPYLGPGNVVIDSCTRCKMVWLDHGEVATIERAPGLR